jgi:hypothetical protein
MRHDPLPREIEAGAFEPPTDIQLLMHTAWLLAGVAIALAASACTVADEAQLHAAPPEPHQNVAHAKPSTTAGNGNVEDMTY